MGVPKKAPSILTAIAKCKDLHVYPTPDPVYGNRSEASGLVSFFDWLLEVEYQKLLVSERLFGLDSENMD